MTAGTRKVTGTTASRARAPGHAAACTPAHRTGCIAFGPPKTRPASTRPLTHWTDFCGFDRTKPAAFRAGNATVTFAIGAAHNSVVRERGPFNRPHPAMQPDVRQRGYDRQHEDGPPSYLPATIHSQVPVECRTHSTALPALQARKSASSPMFSLMHHSGRQSSPPPGSTGRYLKCASMPGRNPAGPGRVRPQSEPYC